jgi:hypothetical protein
MQSVDMDAKPSHFHPRNKGWNTGRDRAAHCADKGLHGAEDTNAPEPPVGAHAFPENDSTSPVSSGIGLKSPL